MLVSGKVFLQTFLQTTPSTVHRGFFKPKAHLFGAASHSRVLRAMGLSVVEAHACQDLQALVQAVEAFKDLQMLCLQQ